MFYTHSRSRPGEPAFGSLSQDAMANLQGEHKRLLSMFTAIPPQTSQRQTSTTRSFVVHGHTTFDGLQGSGIWHTPRSETRNESPEQTQGPPQSRTSFASEIRSTAPPRPEARPPSNLLKEATVSNASRRALGTRHASESSAPEAKSQALRSSRPPRPSAVPPHLREPPGSMSSSEYRESSSPSPSPRPSPRARNTIQAPRRSSRTKNHPVTYNVRRLLGLEKDPQAPDDLQSVRSELSNPFDSNSLSFETPQPTRPADRRPLNISKVLWSREMHGRDPSSRICAAVSSDLQPWKAWKGASNDVLALAWSPDSTKFAAGATTQSDEYNRNKNLLIGDLARNDLYELSDHWICRPAQASGVDDRLFTTVSSTQWVDQRLYTASFDRTVKIWDVQDDERPTCRQTLRHGSNVVTMALSAYQPNLVATGAHSFGIWNIQEGEEPSYTQLPINRTSRQKHDIDLVPSNLVWGHTASTNNLLVGGMSEQTQDDYQVPLCGHLAVWRVNPSSVSSVTQVKATPDSQNIFDIKWHPHLPKFAAATTYSTAMTLPPRTRSVVSVYHLSSDRFVTTHQFPCPAQDMNELTFCPMDSTYVTASCTDGSTYVWDARNPGTVVHRLLHGDSLQPLNHEYPRELTDSGVNVALWGITIDQFYTGGSDGCLKRWDIRRATEDALVTTTTNLGEGIMSGSFSPDKSHLLLGDHAGGIHVLSSGPYTDPDNHEFNEIGPAEAEEVEAPTETDVPGPETGVQLSRDLLSSGQLEMHPIFGPVQGPSYQGPFASWARDADQGLSVEQLRQAPLLEEYQIRQFEGPPLRNRPGLNDDALRVIQQHFNLAYARSGTSLKVKREGKRKRASSTASTSGMVTKPKKKKKKRKRGPIITNVDGGFIDLTADSPEPADSSPS